jgi:hypothetical protein
LDRDYHFLEGKLAKSHCRIDHRFSGCVIFYEHLNDLLIPDFRFGIILCTLSTISWAFGSLYTKKKGGYL